MKSCGKPVIDPVYGDAFCELCCESFAAEKRAHETNPELF